MIFDVARADIGSLVLSSSHYTNVILIFVCANNNYVVVINYNYLI